MNEINIGRYRHYKGNEYSVIGMARHSETLEEHVVYRQEYGDHGLWVRPKQMFLETVKVDGQDVSRFQHLESSSEQVGENVKNIFDELPRHLPKEVVQTLIRAADVRIERIISHGHASPADFWYDQPQHEWVIVLKGAARLQFEDCMVEMKPGDFVNIPAFKKHRVDWTTPDEPTVWLGVRYGEMRPQPLICVRDVETETAQPVYVSDQVREVERLHRDLLTDSFRQLPIRDQLDRQAHRIVEGLKAGNPAVVAHIACWHPKLVCHSADDIMSGPFTLDDARQTIAREYGFADWSDVEARGTNPPDPDFELAVDTLLNGNVEKLRGLLSRNPALIHQRSCYGHRSTLLHYVGSNGVETYRQKVPLNLAEITRLLIDAGADVNATANMYGGGSTALGLLVTSDHPAKAGVTGDVSKVLVEAGAKRD